MKAVERKLPLGFRDLDLSENQEDLESTNIVRKKWKLHYVPPKTHDMRKQICDTDEINLSALCRGIDIYPPEDRAKLKCYLVKHGLGGDRYINELFGRDPYFTIRPIKVEIAHPEPHPITIIHDVISDKESDFLIKQAMPRIHRAPGK